ncbi:MAG: hypothetical protein ACQESR_04970 [Planctomycetota bacterium]
MHNSGGRIDVKFTSPKRDQDIPPVDEPEQTTAKEHTIAIHRDTSSVHTA